MRHRLIDTDREKAARPERRRSERSARPRRAERFRRAGEAQRTGAEREQAGLDARQAGAAPEQGRPGPPRAVTAPEQAHPDAPQALELPASAQLRGGACDLDAEKVRRAGGPLDQAVYTCSCGYHFSAAVSTTVSCPHCGSGQAW